MRFRSLVVRMQLQVLRPSHFNTTSAREAKILDTINVLQAMVLLATRAAYATRYVAKYVRTKRWKAAELMSCWNWMACWTRG